LHKKNAATIQLHTNPDEGEPQLDFVNKDRMSADKTNKAPPPKAMLYTAAKTASPSASTLEC
jgi:hypothetical protein